MRVLTFEIKEVGQETYQKKFNTERTIQWTVKQYYSHSTMSHMNLKEYTIKHQ